MGALDKARESWFQSRIEVFQMIQNTLQQLMALSSAGLVLFFSFIGDAEFLEPALGSSLLPRLGIIAVWCWVIALISAIYGHYIINLMVKDIHDLTKAFNMYSADETAGFEKLDEAKDAKTKLYDSVKDADHQDDESLLNDESLQNEAATYKKVLAEADSFTKKIMAELKAAYTVWENTFIPKQRKAGWALLISLASMATGLVTLATAYTIWVLTQ